MNKIIGQEDLINAVSRIIKIFTSSKCKIKPHFILTGDSGSGKSFTIKTICAENKLQFMEINAAQLTKEGTSGNSLSKALTPLLTTGGKPTVVFVDEFDKLFISGNSNSDMAHEATTGVQNEFLKVLEGEQASVFGDYGKYVNVAISNVLFVFAGAFNNEKDMTLDKLRSFGLKTEFLGRVGLVFHTQPLTIEAMYTIIDESELLKDYCNLVDGHDLEKVQLLLKGYVKDNFDLNTLGARMVNTLIHQYFINGELPKKVVKESTFQTKISFK